MSIVYGSSVVFSVAVYILNNPIVVYITNTLHIYNTLYCAYIIITSMCSGQPGALGYIPVFLAKALYPIKYVL